MKSHARMHEVGRAISFIFFLISMRYGKKIKLFMRIFSGDVFKPDQKIARGSPALLLNRYDMLFLQECRLSIQNPAVFKPVQKRLSNQKGKPIGNQKTIQAKLFPWSKFF